MASSTAVERDSALSQEAGPTERRRTPRPPLIFRSDATFPPLPQSPAAARRWCQDAFSEWGVTADVTEVLAICEALVAFALGYGRGEIRVRLSTGPERITVAVTRGERPEARPSGTGRAILDRVATTATNSGVRDNDDGGTTVWAEVAVGT
jgi:hypothetical protein